jgi:hypothetical protein
MFVPFNDSAPLLRPPPLGIFTRLPTVPFRPEESPLNLRAYRQVRRFQVEVMQRGILGNKTTILRSGPLRSKSVPTTNQN